MHEKKEKEKNLLTTHHKNRKRCWTEQAIWWIPRPSMTLPDQTSSNFHIWHFDHFLQLHQSCLNIILLFLLIASDPCFALHEKSWCISLMLPAYRPFFCASVKTYTASFHRSVFVSTVFDLHIFHLEAPSLASKPNLYTQTDELRRRHCKLIVYMHVSVYACMTVVVRGYCTWISWYPETIYVSVRLSIFDHLLNSTPEQCLSNYTCKEAPQALKGWMYWCAWGFF